VFGFPVGKMNSIPFSYSAFKSFDKMKGMFYRATEIASFAVEVLSWRK
jgi:hypothetical protein